MKFKKEAKKYLTQKLLKFPQANKRKEDIYRKGTIPINEYIIAWEHDLLRKMWIILCSGHMEHTINFSSVLLADLMLDIYDFLIHGTPST